MAKDEAHQPHIRRIDRPLIEAEHKLLENTHQASQGEFITNITSGTLLLAESALLPEALRCESEPFATGWSRVKNFDSNGMDRLIGRAGWSFFYIAGGIEMIAYGADQERATDKALKRILASLKAKKFNCLEITQVAAKRFLGLPYVSVSAHSRHIQAGLILSTD